MGMKGVLLLGLVVGCLSLTACGGGSASGTVSGNSGDAGNNNGNNNQQVAPVALAANYTGTYRTNVVTNQTPFAMSLAQNGSAVTGTFASMKISGQVTGTVTGNNVVLTVTEPNNGGQVTINATVNGNTFAIGSITGVDTFGNNTSGTGSCTAQASPPAMSLPSSYNGLAVLANNSHLLGAVMNGAPSFDPSSGTYPVSVSALQPDGAGNYVGSFTSGFVSGILAMNWFALGSEYYFNIYPKNDYSWFYGNGGNNSLTDVKLAFFRNDNPNGAYVTANMNLHSGDIHQDLVGTWSYTSTAATGVKNFQLVVTTVDGTNFTARITATVQGTVGVAADTVSGDLQGVYDLTAQSNPRITLSGFAMRFAPVVGSPLTISNTSGLTPSFTVYLSYLDKTAGTINVDVDSGASTVASNTVGLYRNLTLTKQ